MSLNSSVAHLALDCRSTREGVRNVFALPAGVRAAAKRSLRRVDRQQGKQALMLDMQQLSETAAIRKAAELAEAWRWYQLPHLKMMAELTDDAAEADLWLMEWAIDTAEEEWEGAHADEDSMSVEAEEIPLELQGSLPDHVLAELEVNSYASALFQRFEAKPLSRGANFIVSQQDEGELDY